MIEEIFQNFIIERNFSKRSVKHYRTVLLDYTNLIKTLMELIEEADNEEEERVRSKKTNS
jgi:hypothetical protein